MSAEKRKIIKKFCERFLNVDKTPKSFSEILNQSPAILKDCSKEEAEILKKYKFEKIRDLNKIDYEKIPKYAKKMGIDEHQLRKWVLAAGLVKRAWQKRSQYLKKQEIKIAVLGLDNAGKTSMLEAMSGKAPLGEITDLQPTRGVDIRRIDSENYNMVIWDFGGQIGHRHDYLQNPEEYFLQIDLIIYVIDTQDTERYDESLEYFKQIMEIMTFLKEHPYVLVLLHKADPDIYDDPDFQINLEYIKGKFQEILEGTEYAYEIIETSIYNLYSTEPEFAKTFKRFFTKSKTGGTLEEMIQGLSEAVMKLNVLIVKNFTEL